MERNKEAERTLSEKYFISLITNCGDEFMSGYDFSAKTIDEYINSAGLDMCFVKVAFTNKKTGIRTIRKVHK